MIDLELDITPTELKGWLISPITQEIFRAVRQKADEYNDARLNGKTLNLGSMEATALLTVHTVSYCEGLKFILGIEELLEDEEMKEDE